MRALAWPLVSMRENLWRFGVCIQVPVAVGASFPRWGCLELVLRDRFWLGVCPAAVGLALEKSSSRGQKVLTWNGCPRGAGSSLAGAWAGAWSAPAAIEAAIEAGIKSGIETVARIEPPETVPGRDV